MFFIRSDIPAKVISTDKNPFESFYVVLNCRKKKMAIELFLQSKQQYRIPSELSFQEYRLAFIEI